VNGSKAMRLEMAEGSRYGLMVQGMKGIGGITERMEEED
jgi:hypothetical protein